MNCATTHQLNKHLDKVDSEQQMKEIQDDIITALIQGAEYTYEINEYDAYTFYPECVLDSIQYEIDSGDFCEIVFGLAKQDEEQSKRFNDLLVEHATRIVEEYFQ